MTVTTILIILGSIFVIWFVGYQILTFKSRKLQKARRELREWAIAYERTPKRVLEAIEFLQGCEDIDKGKEFWLSFSPKSPEKLRMLQDFIETGSEDLLEKGLIP